jgi:hypothetical protein
VTARITWRVVRHDGPTPGEDTGYRYRGGPDVIAVPGDLVRVRTADGVLEGEPHAELFVSTTAFLLLTSEGMFYVDPARVEELVDDDWEPT